MKTARQAARQRRHIRRLMLGGTLALTATGVLAYLVMGVLPGHGANAGSAAGIPSATTQVTAAGSAEARPSATSASPTTTGTPSPTAAATSASARPSAKGTPRSRGTRSTTAVAAGRIRPHTTYSGVATAYEAGDGNGACLFGPSADLMIAAMNTTDYETSRACGAYVLVHASNGASVTVRITNECPLPCAPGQLDLSQQAFAKLADLKVGRLAITWQLVSPSAVGTMSIRYKTGSSPYWCGIQVIGHRNPVARLEVRTPGGWRQLPRTDYNYFISANGGGCGGSIRVTDLYGEQLTVSGIALRPDVVQPTRVQFARH